MSNGITNTGNRTAKDEAEFRRYDTAMLGRDYDHYEEYELEAVSIKREDSRVNQEWGIYIGLAGASAYSKTLEDRVRYSRW